jgi:methionyl-tRNA formyltransferase
MLSFLTRDLNSTQGGEFLRSIQLDLLISVHFEQKWDRDLHDKMGYTAINLYPSRLPLHQCSNRFSNHCWPMIK